MEHNENVRGHTVSEQTAQIPEPAAQGPPAPVDAAAEMGSAAEQAPQITAPPAEASGMENPELALMIFLGRMLFESGRNTDAAAILKKALGEAEKQYEFDHPVFGQILSLLADIYKARGAGSAVIPICERAVQSMELSQGRDALPTAREKEKLARALILDQQCERAELLLNQTLRVYRQSLPDGSPEIAGVHEALGELFLARNAPECAAGEFHAALEIQEQVLDQDDPELAKTLYMLGVQRRQSGKLLDALTYHRRALSIRRLHQDTEYMPVIQSLTELSFVLQQLGRLPEAEELLRQALALGEARQGYDHPLTAHTCYSLSLLLLQQEKFADAELALHRVERSYLRHFGAAASELRTVYQALSVVYKKLGMQRHVKKYQRLLGNLPYLRGPGTGTVLRS